jgi:SAM-dependent methyltransferase
MESATALQRAYYARTAADYDHRGERALALAFLRGFLDLLEIRSVLDVGAGNGHVLLHLKEMCPRLRLVGIEPSAEMRAVGHASGLARDELIEGDGASLAYADGAFDLVSEFGVLHHVAQPSRVVGEMLRVAGRAVFFSDSNNFGQGSAGKRALKQALQALRLWPLANYLKTRGRGYRVDEGDGVSYSYSLFSDYAQIAAACERDGVHVLNGAGDGRASFRRAPAVTLLGIKRASRK